MSEGCSFEGSAPGSEQSGPEIPLKPFFFFSSLSLSSTFAHFPGGPLSGLCCPTAKGGPLRFSLMSRVIKERLCAGWVGVLKG